MLVLRVLNLQISVNINIPPTSLLLFGATGYIGGTFLSHLLNKFGSTLVEHYHITFASRSLEKAERIRDLIPGSSVIALSLQDLSGIETESQKYDIIVQSAGDDLKATEALLLGMRKRQATTGVTPILYQVSGAAIVLEDLGGRAATHVVSDTESDKINSLPLDIPHRDIDDAIVQADLAGYIRSYILAPSVVFGKPMGTLHETGLANSATMAINGIAYAAVNRRAVGQVGPGENVWSICHVDDVASLLLEIVENPPSTHGRDGFYFVENGSLPVQRAVQLATKALYSEGLVDTDTATQFTTEELTRYMAPWMGWNLVCRAEKGKQLGWEPHKGVEEFEKYLVEEVHDLAMSVAFNWKRRS
ncbi:hypothetical protein ACJZ2D_014272 [Fusarium nematophilum]